MNEIEVDALRLSKLEHIRYMNIVNFGIQEVFERSGG